MTTEDPPILCKRTDGAGSGLRLPYFLRPVSCLFLHFILLGVISIAAAAPLPDDIRLYDRCLTAIEGLRPSGQHLGDGTSMGSPVESRLAADGSAVAPSLGRAMHLLITSYQVFLSSQDTPACNYLPSCSHYAQDAIRERGPILGILMASDRLQRCIGFARRHYRIDPVTGRAIDPVLPLTQGPGAHEHSPGWR